MNELKPSKVLIGIVPALFILVSLLAQEQYGTLSILVLVALLSILGFIPAYIASKKGRSFAFWFVYGVGLFIVALIHAIFAKPYKELELMQGTKRSCPECEEPIKVNAKACPHCSSKIEPITQEELQNQKKIYTEELKVRNKPYKYTGIGLIGAAVFVLVISIIVPIMQNFASR